MATYTKNFETLIEMDMKVNETSTLKFKLDKDKRSDRMKMHIREYVETDLYTGYTKNGVNLNLDSVADVEQFRGVLNTFLDQVETEL